MIVEYKEYIELIKEGLIRTHNIIKSKMSLTQELCIIGIKYDIDIESKLKFSLTLFETNKFDDRMTQYIVNYVQNQLGYNPSFIYVENNIGVNGFKFDKKYLSNKYKSIKIVFEAKYDDGLYKNDIVVPKIMYHLSPVDNESKIKNNGLCVKNGNRRTLHPHRTYLFYNLEDYQDLLNSLKYNDSVNNINRNYNLYEIEMNDNIIHTDPNYVSGVYTYDSFHPEFLKIIKNNI